MGGNKIHISPLLPAETEGGKAIFFLIYRLAKQQQGCIAESPWLPWASWGN